MPPIPAAPNLPLGNVVVQDQNGAPVGTSGGGKFYTLRFVGGSAPVDKGGGVVEIDVSPAGGGSVEVLDDGVSLGDFTKLDFVGFTLTDLGGNEVQIAASNTAALAQTEWYVDAASGSDSNTGLTALTALATYGEILRRWGDGGTLGPGTITIHLIDVTDPVSLALARTYVGPDTILILQGVATTVRSGSFTAVTAANRGTNTPWSATDGAMPGTWTADLGRRVRITTAGPNFGNIFWVGKDLGAKTARFSWPCLPPTLDGNNDRLTPGAITAGDAYVVETFNTVTLDSIAPVANGYGSLTTTIPTVYLQNMDATASDFIAISNEMALVLIGVHLTGFVLCEGNEAVFSNCCFEAGFQFTQYGAEASTVDAGLVRVTGFPIGPANLDANVLFQGCGLECEASSLGLVSVFDAPAAAITIDSKSGPSYFDTFRYGTFGGHALFGSGNVGVGVALAPGAELLGTTTIPTITGTAGNFTLAGSATPRAWDEAGGGYTAPIAATWANFSTAVAGGGFGNNAHELASSTHLFINT